MAETKAQNRYRVIERLESGGMAEVFRGEAESLAGFKKQVAIKRVLPHLAQNEKFIRMFLDEARLCARLNHANIVQVFDIGHVENTYFIVMEFVDGVNLKAIVDHMKKRDQTVSLAAAAYMAMQICNGLQYAHDLTDSDGNLLHIVHRDMSPPNVLISKRGEIKIVDFGLAKAAMSVEKTDPGVVKGKFSYLAPETAMGKEADAQADIFAVGIMLWEMLSGRKLFLGDSDYQTVKQVQQAVIPSLRKINPKVPDALEVILLKALARDKSQRHPTAEALAEDLAHFLSGHQLAITSFDIAKIVREVVEERRVQAKKEGKRDVSIIDKLIMEELVRFTSLDEPGGAAASADSAGAKPLTEDFSKPLTGDDFVNPSSWASDVLGDDFNPSADKGTSGWREQGLDSASAGSLADVLESDDEPSPAGGAPASSGDDDASDEDDAKPLAQAGPPASLVAGARTSGVGDARGSSAKSGGSGGVIAAVTFVAIAGVGAALWFLKFIPH
ncbi:MAG: serine/threonine-protein kinase [Deltaproteobacteria bacterium]